MRVVFDNNVLYSALAAKGFCEEVLDEAAGNCVIIWSRAMREELETVLARRHKIGPATQAAFAAYIELCEFVEPERLPRRVCRDKNDDFVLGTALAGKAELVVTGDNDLLTLKEYEGVKIISPREFLDLLG